MKRALILLALALAAVGHSATAPTTPINNVKFTGTMNGTPSGGTLDLSLVNVIGVSGVGTVTTIPDGSTNGVTWTVATRTSTPTFTFTLGAIAPSSVAATGTVTGSNLSGTNTGDQTTITGNAGTATALQTPRAINGVSFDGTASITVTAAAGTLTGTTLNSTVTAAPGLLSASGGAFGTAAFTAATAYTAANGAITGATKTKITYDAKGLVTAGADATTADIPDSTNKRYVTDAELVVIGNTSGTNTGDQTTVSGNAGTATALQTARTINGVSFDGTANITVPAAAGTLTGSSLASGVTAAPGLLSASGGSFGTAAFTAASAYEPALGNPSVTGYVLSSTTGGVRSWVAQSGGGGTPGGLDTQVQFNDGGAFGGNSGLVYNKTTHALTATGAITGSNLSGTNTGDQTTISGNAGTATALQTARTINGVSFDGTTNITVTAAGSTLSDTVTIAKGGTGQITAGPALDALRVQGADVASATTTNIGAATGFYIDVTGTTTITAFDTVAAGRARLVRFTGALTLTHNATTLILPGGANITTAAGDVAEFVSLGSGNWRCVNYVRGAAPPVSGTNTGDQTTVSGNAGTATALQTARTINGTNFDGTANITVTAAAGTLTGTTLNSSVVTSSLTSVGTLGTGVWQGTAVAGQYGGTGVANTGKTITLGGNVTTSGAFALTLTLSATTSVTLPTTGTLATLAGSEAFTNKTYNKVTLTAPATSSTLTIADGKTLTVNNDTTLDRQSSTGLPVEFAIACSDMTTAITATTDKAYFRAPYAFTVTEVRASLFTAQASGSIFTVNIKKSGTTILSTKITIDNTQKTSTTATTPPVISVSSVADDNIITVDVDQIGTSGAAGLIVWIKGYR